MIEPIWFFVKNNIYILLHACSATVRLLRSWAVDRQYGSFWFVRQPSFSKWYKTIQFFLVDETIYVLDLRFVRRRSGRCIRDARLSESLECLRHQIV